MKTARFFLLIPLLFAALPAPALAFDAAAVLSGYGRAHDGDDIRFGAVRVRLQGVAAPENSAQSVEPHGQEAFENLQRLVEGKLIVCHLDGTTASSNRPVGMCFAGGLDLGREQVLGGFARDCPAFSGGRYAEAEAAAREAGNDLSRIYELPNYC